MPLKAGISFVKAEKLHLRHFSDGHIDSRWYWKAMLFYFSNLKCYTFQHKSLNSKSTIFVMFTLEKSKLKNLRHFQSLSRKIEHFISWLNLNVSRHHVVFLKYSRKEQYSNNSLSKSSQPKLWSTSISDMFNCIRQSPCGWPVQVM